MEYTVKVPAILGDTCNLSSVAQAMALKPATAAEGEWDEKTFDAMERRYSTWLREEALSGHLVTCDSAGIPTPWKVLMGSNEPVDVTVACCRAWVKLNQLNKWAHDAGHSFTIQSEGVPWIDHRGVVGGSLAAPLTVSINERTYQLGLKHHKAVQPVGPGVVKPDSVGLVESQQGCGDTGPEPLATSVIAHCFSGLANHDRQWWIRALGRKPGWLEDSLVTRGERGVAQRRWNPVKIGARLIDRSGVSPIKVRARFQTHAELKPWYAEWQTYEYQRMGE